VANLFRGTVESLAGGIARVRTESGLVLEAVQDGGYRAGQSCWLGLRSERISLKERSSNVLEGTIEDEIFLGDWTDWRVRVGRALLSVGEGNVLARGRQRGDAVTLSFPAEAVLRLEDPEA
jgi:ABC-type Fe3+/spermidine/putrescine transport system ATPase subunit